MPTKAKIRPKASADPPAITIAKAASVHSFAAAGTKILYTYTVTNSGDVTLNGITVTDTKTRGVSCPRTTLAPGESTICTSVYTTTATDVSAGHVDNTATVTGTTPTGGTVTDTASLVISRVAAPAMSITKTASVRSFAVAGTVITYTYRVTNTGNVDLHGVTVGDTKVGHACGPLTLAVAQTTTCTARYVTTAADAAAGHVDNTATVTGTTPTGGTVTDTASLVIPRVVAPAVSISKSADVTSFSAAGERIFYTYRVTNNGNETLHIDVTDSKVGFVCGVDLLPGAVADCHATYFTTAADVAAGFVDNTATATGRTENGETVSDDTDLFIPLEEAAGIDIEKSADVSSFSGAGEQITYTYRVTNSGNVPLHDVIITDSNIGHVCGPLTIEAGETVECAAQYFTTQEDVAAGRVINTATVTGRTPGGVTVEAETGLEIPVEERPGISIEKIADVPSFSEAGQPITYTFVVVNNGNVPLHDVIIHDTKLGHVCGPFTLEVGELTKCEATYFTTPEDVDAREVANTATVTGLTPGGVPVEAESGLQIPLEERPDISITKKPSVPSFAAAGEIITYTYEVANFGNVRLHNVIVTDDKVGHVCEIPSLSAGETVFCQADYETTPEDVAARFVVNTATVTGVTESGLVLSDSDASFIPLEEHPAISITKKPSVPSFAAAGETIEYTYEISNNGNAPLHDVTVTDTKIPGGFVCHIPSLAVGEFVLCHAFYVTTPEDVAAREVANTALATGLTAGGLLVEDKVSELVPLEERPAVSIEKAADVPTFAAAGETIDYTYRVTNDGNVPLHNVVIDDPRIGIVCHLGTLEIGEAVECHAVYITTPEDVAAREIADTAIVTGFTAEGVGVSADDSLLIPLEAHPAISIAKIPSVTSFAAAGETIEYTYKVSNNGNVPLDGVTVTDSKTGAVCHLGTLGVGEAVECRALYVTTPEDVAAREVADTAVVTGTTPGGVQLSDADSVVIPLVELPGVIITKTSSVTIFAAAGETIEYTYRVTNSGNVPLHGVTVTDAKTGAVCHLGTLGVGEAVECRALYVTTAADVAAREVANTAVVTGTTPGGVPETAEVAQVVPLEERPGISITKSPSVSSFAAAGETIVYTYRVTNSGNVPLHGVVVTDSRVGHVCGPLVLAVGQATTCTARYVTTAADVAAREVANTAVVTGTTPGGVPETAEVAEVIPLEERPSVSITKSPSVSSFAAAGETIVYTYRVTNSGNVPLHGVTVADSKVGHVCGPLVLAVGQETTCTARYVTTAADVAAGRVANTAVVAGTTPGGVRETAEVAEVIPLRVRPGVSIRKTASVASFTGAGKLIKYTYRVTNTGSVPLHGLAVTDSKAGAVSCPAAVLAPRAAMTCRDSYKVTKADVAAGRITNVATVSGLTPGGVRVKARASLTIKRKVLPVTG